ncbi:hypothetical protein [Paenibacillus xylanexedens]|uniref:hypothetical protein n=1 Tax=Paenibacillus xylanexedens TaxID=528191 RepID=UPI0011A473E2|nr:hypothetical protein [Paenibacillus xylanexedens]
MRDRRETWSTPYLSYIGFGLVVMTVMVNLIFKWGIEQRWDMGSLMLLSLANALSLLFTLVWGIFGVLEFATLRKQRYRIKLRAGRGAIDPEEQEKQIRILKRSMIINISYIVILLCQLGYVILNWDEIDI